MHFNHYTAMFSARQSCLILVFLLSLIQLNTAQELENGKYKLEFIKGDDVIRFQTKLDCNGISCQLSSIDPIYDFNLVGSLEAGLFLGFDADYEGGCLLRGRVIDSKSLYGDGVWDQLSENPVFVKFSLKQQTKGEPLPKDDPIPSPQPKAEDLPQQLSISSGILKDPRDQQTYKTTTINGQTWMAENLRFKTVGGCIENIALDLGKYGYYYNWRAANMACPKGWHLPSADEWQALIEALGAENAAQALKAENSWQAEYRGSNTAQFNILPAGFFSPSLRDFTKTGEQALFWSATDYFSQEAYYFSIDQQHKTVEKKAKDKKHAFSCRCLKDQ